MSRVKVKLNRIDHILISHLHGDHYFGLIGLISTMHLFGRKNDLNIYCPSALKEILDVQFKHSETVLNFNIIYHFLDRRESDIIFENKDLYVKAFPLDHQIFCTGFLFREKVRNRKINADKLPLDFSIANIAKLKKGEDIVDEAGNILYRNEDLTFHPRPPRSYAFCSDTRYNEDLIPYITGCDLLYHESTFMNDMKDRAESTYHSTAEQAALMAIQAKAKKLLLGHFSVRYRELEPLLMEAKQVFPESYLAIEGEYIDIEN